MEDQSSGKKSFNHESLKKVPYFSGQISCRLSLSFPCVFPSNAFQTIHKNVGIFLTQQPFIFLFIFFLRNHVILHTFVISLPCLDTLYFKSSSREQHENIFPCVEFDKLQKRKIQLRFLRLFYFLYNITSIQNSFVQCTMRASMYEPLNNKQLLPFSY